MSTKGVLFFIIWMVIGWVTGQIFDYHGFVDILFWPMCAVYKIIEYIRGE